MAKLPRSLTITLGKTVRRIARLRGGGSALPGLFVEHISPSFVPDTLRQLPYGVVVVSGTNGKTTTTKMVVSLLESQGLRVFTNKTGSNFVRGVAAALLGEVSLDGRLDADIAVLELDEAHAVKFVNVVKPHYALLLNVMRDQLDRFGEIDTTAKLLQIVAKNTTKSVVLNREDHRIEAIKSTLHGDTTAQFFGLNPKLVRYFPNDDDLHSEKRTPQQSHAAHGANTNSGTSAPARRTSVAPASAPTPTSAHPASVILDRFNDNGATFIIGGTSYATPLKLRGIYNIYNAAAALALVRTILPNAPTQNLLTALSSVTPAFGRGETIIVDGDPFELVLVKNPAGFRLSLASFSADNYATIIAINDNYADGRDMSWLWDVSFASLDTHPVCTTGTRAYDMALRLQYDDIPVENVEPSLPKALDDFIAKHKGMPKRAYCTYTAMLTLRKELAKISTVEEVL